ncbi:MAG: hypothetical protein EZS28_012079 [Streblomastix strix]|uniref:Uncharacterized protein n=1 Tax=Streblomastix strix TaxID=222440 RepID=A0A5J4WD68_9EUKA|nr:MAG: hypothetical protein EZS28_012079 [Streblomastix strix]
MSIVTDFVEIRQYFDAYNLDQQNSTQTVNQFENKATKVKGIFKTQIEGAQICSIDQQGCYDLKLDQSFGTVPNESNICICIGIGHSLRSTIEELIQLQSNISPNIPHQPKNIANIPPPDFILPMYQQQQQKLKQLPPQRIKPSAIAMNAPRQRNIQKDNNQQGNQLQLQNQQQYQQQQQFQYQPPMQSRLPPIGKIVPSAPIDSERVNPNAQQQQIAPIFGQYNNIPPQAPAPFDSEHPNQDTLCNNNFNIVDELK